MNTSDPLQTLWAKRWLAIIEGYGIPSRLQRGRLYALQGHVLEIIINKGLIEAKVQGTRTRPYRVGVHLKQLALADWDKITEAIAHQADLTTKLLAKNMPDNIEEVFHQAELQLFPKNLTDFSAECSCPDFANPCKHVIAVLYALEQEFVRDPLLIFTLRGKTPSEFINALARLRTATQYHRQGARPIQAWPVVDDASTITGFWGDDSQLDQFPCKATKQLHPLASPLKTLGPPPQWPAEIDFFAMMEPIYHHIRQKTLPLLHK